MNELPGDGPSGVKDLAALSAGRTLELGRHRISLTGDVVRMLSYGSFDLAELIRLHRIFEVMLERRCEAFLLVVVVKEGTVSSDARRWVAEWNQQHQSGGAAILGISNAVTRAVFNLVVRASSLVRSQPMPIVLCSSEEEAYHWFAQRRRVPK